MWENCGVVRNEERLQSGLNRLLELRGAAEHVDVRPSSEGYKDLALALDLRGEQGNQVLSRKPADPVPAGLERWLEVPEEMSLAKRLLE
jgi:hypothetical protein